MNPETCSYEDNKTYKAQELYLLSDKIEELHKIQEELKQAKDEAMQSWLDSRPLIDELENLKSELADAKVRSENTVVTKLESELMAVNISIRLKKEEDLKARTEINEMNRVTESLREEIERNKVEINQGKQERSRMKMVIKMTRQKLRTVKLTLRAVRLETEAYRASAEAALEQITRAQVSSTHGSTIELTQEDYFALTRQAKEEASLADWRVVVATEQRLAAEERCDLILKRLSELTLNGGLIKDSNEEILDEEVSSFRNRAATPFNRAPTPFQEARAILMARERVKTKTNQRRLVSKMKGSIFVKVKSFFARKMKSLFG